MRIERIERIEKLRKVERVQEKGEDRQQQSNNSLSDRKQYGRQKKPPFILKTDQHDREDKIENRTVTDINIIKKQMEFEKSGKITRLRDQLNNEAKKEEKVNKVRANKGYEDSIKIAEELGEKLAKQKEQEER